MMFEVLLKASLAIAIALLFYKIVLQKESFFATNRIYLIGCLALAFVFPWISLPKFFNQQGVLSKIFEPKVVIGDQSINYSGKTTFEIQPVSVLIDPSQEALKGTPATSTETASQVISSETPGISGTDGRLLTSVATSSGVNDIMPVTLSSEEIIENRYTLMFWVSLVYLLGVAIFSLSLLFQLGYIVYQIITAPSKIREGGYVIVNMAERKAPCSFFNYIFISPDDYDFETYEQIIAHEKAHVRLGHSFDLILAELAVIALWFNPFVWFLRKEIEKNNEYQTDWILLENEEVRKEHYQFNLLKIAVPNKPLNITTNYNQSLIKQRIVMMNSKRSTPQAYWKYAFLIPLFIGTLLLMNEPATAQVQQEKSETDVADEIKLTRDNSIKNVVRTKDVLRERQDIQDRKPTAQREPEDLIERKENVQREREEIVDRAAMATLKREQFGERVSVSQNMRETTRPNVANRTSLVNRNHVERTSQQDFTKGVWYGNIRNGSYCIEFKSGNENNRWNMSRCFEQSAFKKGQGETFVMTNEVGTLELTGNLNAEVSQGKFNFKEDVSFRDFLAKNTISGISPNNMFHLFLGDITRDYVNYLKQQFPAIEGKELTSLAIHEVKQKDFKKYVSFFEKYSGGKASISDVVGLKIHGVTEEYVRELQHMGFSNLSMDKIMAAKIHGVSAEYSRSLQNSGFSNLTIDDIISAKIHGITPQTINEMKELGAKGLQEIVSLHIHEVSPAYVKELRASGLKELSLNQVLSAKIHGLNAASIQEINAMGFKTLDFDDLLSAKIHQVDPAFVKDLERAGFTNLDMNEIVSARIHGINGDFIEKARKDGHNLNSIDKYISLKIHSRALESLKDN